MRFLAEELSDPPRYVVTELGVKISYQKKSAEYLDQISCWLNLVFLSTQVFGRVDK